MEPLCSEPPGDLCSKCKKEGRVGQAGTPGGEKKGMIHIFLSNIWTVISSGDLHKKNYNRNVIDFHHSTQNLRVHRFRQRNSH